MTWDSFWRQDATAMVSAPAASALAAWWRAFFAGCAFRPSPVILEVACGASPVCLHAEHRLGAHAARRYVASDLAIDALLPVARRPEPFLAVAADATLPPFRDGAFDAVVSQFGVEYGGVRAVARAAALAAPGGAFGAVLHLRGGDIAVECETAAAALADFAAAGVTRAARRALEASYAHAAAARFEDAALERAASKALAVVRARPDSTPLTEGRRLVRRYLDDIENLLARRFAFAPEEALGWLARVESDLAAYRRRMEAMTRAAIGEPHMRALVRSLGENGLVAVEADKLDLGSGRPAAWTLVARRPAS